MGLTLVDLIWIIPLFALMLSVLVFVHELGHFATALLFGIRVEEFAIGFPPRAFAIHRNGIDYAINWLPLGGYVKIVGENGDSNDPRSFGKAPAWQRIIVLAAGSFMNLLLAIIIFTGLSLSGVQEVNAPQTGVSDVKLGQPAALGGMQPGDKIVSIAGKPVSTLDDLRSLSRSNAGSPTQIMVERNGKTVSLNITPAKGIDAPLGIGVDYWISPARVQEVNPSGVADKAGLKPGDEIVQVNGHDVDNVPAVSYWFSMTNSTTDKVAQVEVKRGGQTIGPLKLKIEDLRKSPGFLLYQPLTTHYYGPGEALGRSLGTTWGTISFLPAAIKDMFAGRAQGPGVTGPVGIGQLVAEVAQQSGLIGVLNLTAYLGISLFMINMLPLPALDGGRLLFIIIELLRGGRRIAPEKEGLAHLAGMVVLLTFILIITFFDVQRLFGGGSLTR